MRLEALSEAFANDAVAQNPSDPFRVTFAQSDNQIPLSIMRDLGGNESVAKLGAV